MRVAIRGAVATSGLGLLVSCSDVVIGNFVAGTGSEGASTGDGPLLPGECVVESFDAGFDAAQWLTWADADATTTAQGGVLELVPPTMPLFGTGLVLRNERAVDFATATVRVEVITPPDPGSLTELFLQVTQQVPLSNAVLSLGLFQGGVRVSALHDDGSQAFSQPAAASYPRWIGIRTADGLVYFETSDDGDAWDTVASFDLPASFAGATPLVMAWNNDGGLVTPQTVVVDSLVVCAD